MESLAIPLFVAVLLAFVGFRQWLRHQQRVLVHRERLVALEKGVELPPWPDAPPPSIGLVGLPAALVGVAHLVVYGVQRRGPR